MPMHPMFELGYHAEATKEANGGLLDDQLLAFVIAANLAQDLHQTTSYIHFDNCEFAGGVEYLDGEWKMIEEVGDRFGLAALGAFGRLLHTTQDFYAHSNWIELHSDKSPMPLWDRQVDSLPKDIVSGTWWIGGPKLCGPNAPTHSQLNKDGPDTTEGSKIVDSGPNDGKSLFELAFAAAVQASVRQYERFAKVDLAEIDQAFRPQNSDELFLRLIGATRNMRNVE